MDISLTDLELVFFCKYPIYSIEKLEYKKVILIKKKVEKSVLFN